MGSSSSKKKKAIQKENIDPNNNNIPSKEQENFLENKNDLDINKEILNKLEKNEDNKNEGKIKLPPIPTNKIILKKI